MAQPVTAILLQQDELAAKARRFTQDTNEAGLLVGKVVLRALDTFQEGITDEVLAAEMRRDLDRLIDQMRRAPI